MKKNNKNKFTKTMIIPLTLSLVIFILYKNADTKFEQLLIMSIFIIYIIPFALHLLSMLFNGLLYKPNSKGNNINKEDSINKVQKNDSKTKHKTKEINNPYYIELRDRLVEVVKNKHLNRDSILKLKLEVDKILDINKYNYSKFVFKNDLHEIYTKIKSSKLTTDDYIYLKLLLEDLVGWFLYVILYVNYYIYNI